MQPRTALLLIAHGSREPQANRELHEAAARLRGSGIGCSVFPCFLEIESPDIPSAFEQATAGGAENIIAFPYFLSTGAHVRKDIPEILASCARNHPTVNVTLTRALGPDPALDQIVEARLREGGMRIDSAEGEEDGKRP